MFGSWSFGETPFASDNGTGGPLSLTVDMSGSGSMSAGMTATLSLSVSFSGSGSISFGNALNLTCDMGGFGSMLAAIYDGCSGLECCDPNDFTYSISAASPLSLDCTDSACNAGLECCDPNDYNYLIN